MIIQASNGRYYRNPVWRSYDGIVTAFDNEIRFYRRGCIRVGWRTAVKALTAMGIRAKPVGEATKGSAIFQHENEEFGKLLPTTEFEITFSFPPPVPSACEQDIDPEPEPTSDDEAIVKWPKKRKRSRGRTSTSDGETFSNSSPPT